MDGKLERSWGGGEAAWPRGRPCFIHIMTQPGHGGRGVEVSAVQIQSKIILLIELI